MVSLEKPNLGHRCGGAILNEEWILTAGHCFFNYGDTVTGDYFTVHAGSTDQTDNEVGQRVGVDELFFHPDYYVENDSSRYDIALMKLSQPLEFNEHVQPIKYADSCNTSNQDVSPGNIALLSGWGKSETSSQGVSNLRSLEIPIISNQEANQILSDDFSFEPRSVEADQIAFYENFGGQYSGDSGGPYIIEKNGNKYEIGVVAWSLHQAEDDPEEESNIDYTRPSVASRVRHNASWIESITGISASASGVDLYMKDRPWDMASEPSEVDIPYLSEDIWVRSLQDGFENHTHQNPHFTGSNSVFVYVRVRNNGCIASTPSDMLSAYWAKAAISLS